MDKIRILHIIKTLRLGGAEVNLLNLIEAMDPMRFEIFVAYSAGGELEGRFIKAGVKLFKFADEDQKIKSFASFGIVARLAGFIRRNKIAVVHTHTFNAQIWGGIAAKLTGARILEHVHDFRYTDPDDFVRRRGFSRQYKMVHYFKDFSDLVVVLTQQNAEFLQRHHLYAPEKVREQLNGIPLPVVQTSDPVRAREGRAKYGIPLDAVVVLTAVRLAPEKNIDLVLRIASDVLARCPNVVFVIAGDGPLSADLKAQAVSRGLSDAVRFIGFEADVRGLLAMSDIFLLPSFLELHSIAVLEAMSMACPLIISRDVGSHGEFIRDGENGLLLDPFADAGWADAVISLAHDPLLRQRLGTAGHRTCCEKFDIRQTAKQFEGYYAEIA